MADLRQFQRMWEEEDRREATVSVLDNRDPSRVLNARKVGRQVGAPAALVEADPQTFEMQLQQQRARAAVEKDPWLARYLTVEGNAAAAKPDLERLGNIGKLVADEGELTTPFIRRLRSNNLGETALGTTVIPSRPRDVPFRETAARIRARNTPVAPTNPVAAFGRDVVRALPRGTVRLSAGLTGLAKNYLDLQEEFDVTTGLQERLFGGTIYDPVQSAIEGLISVQDRQLDEMKPESQGLTGAFVGGVESIPSTVAGLGFAMLGRPDIGLGLLGGSVAGESYLDARREGLGVLQATTYGASQGAVEVGTEAIPMFRFIKDMQIGSSFGKRLLANWSTEQVGEQTATVLQDLNRWAAIESNQGKTFGDYLAERPEAALHTLVAVTATTLGTNVGIAAVERLTRSNDRDQRDIAGSIAGAQFLDNLMKEAEASEMRKADPESFREFVAQRTEGTPVRNIFIPTEVVAEFMQSEGYEGELDAYRDQLQEAQATGGESIVIPIGDAAANLAGTPAWDKLRDNVRIQPGGLSQKEATEKRDEIMKGLEVRGAEIAKEAAAEVEAASPAVEVYNEVKNQLLSIGRSTQEAENVAQLWAASRETWAQRLSKERVKRGETPITAMEYHKANPIEFADATMGARAGGQRTLDQAQGRIGEALTRKEAQQLADYWNGITPGSTTVEPTRRSTQKRFGARYDVIRRVDPSTTEVVSPELTEDVETEQPRDLFQSIDDLTTYVPGLHKVLPYLADDEKAKLRKDTAKKIVEMVETFPDAEEMASVAFSGRAKRGWYERSALALLQVFGAEDASRFAALLAATSPQTSVEQNTINALNIWVAWDEAGRPTDTKKIRKIMGGAVQGKKGEGSILDAWWNNTVRALTADNPADITLSGPKVNSFMLNLIGVVDEVTNDAWMANYALIDQKTFKIAGQAPGKSPGYIAFTSLVRRAADVLTKRTGELWTPAEVQETVWSWTKAVTETRATGDAKTVEQLLEAGAVTNADINATPDFASLFQRGIYRRILEAGGYGEEIEQLGLSDREATGSAGDAGSVFDAEGAGIDPADFRRHLLTAGARIEERVGGNKHLGATTIKAAQRRGTTAQGDLFANYAMEPLTGLPTPVKVEGVPVEFGPFAQAREAARRYALRYSLPMNPPTDYARVDVERATRIAQAFEEMEHNPNDPEVKRAYRAMMEETVLQWRMIKETGLKVDFIEGEDPYGNPRNAIIDVVENNHLWVFPTDDGFGGSASAEIDISGNPLLEFVPGEKISGKPVRYNDIFRIVHDYFGHIKEGVGFRADGEENAWRIHSSMYSPLARRAMTTETRGQNSWVNYGPFGESNRTASGADTQYAPQKIGLLPEWVVTEGSGQETRSLYQLADVFTSTDMGIVEPAGERLVFHGTPFSFDQFKGGAGRGAVWFSEGRRLAEVYADPRRRRMSGEGRVIEARISPQVPLDLDRALSKLPSHHVVDKPIEWVKEQFGFDLVKHGWGRIGQEPAETIFRSAAFADAARAAGYDALHVTEGSASTWGMLDTGSVTTPGGERTLFQSPIFYSALERAIEATQTKRAPAAQWKATLGKAPGVKQEELIWSGLLDWLDMQEGPVDREALLVMIRENGITVDEVVLGRSQEDLLADYGYTVDDLEDPEHEANLIVEDPQLNPQFQSWSSDPSNETYRELLITLPLGQGGNPGRAPSTHWDVEAVVAHTRFMEKRDAEGKRVLFVEEIQSDWHQKGRDEGYAQQVTDEEQERLREAAIAASREVDEAREELEQYAGDRWEALRPLATGTRNGINGQEMLRQAAMISEEAFTAAERLVTANLREIEAGRDHNNALRPGGIPEAPFKSSWPALVMKRIIRYAVDNGFERVAWTTGEEQAERYNLSAATGPIRAATWRDTGNYLVQMDDRAKDKLVENNMAERQPRVSSRVEAVVMTADQLKEAFGADVAKRIVERADAAAGKYGEALEGNDLRIGGEGMKAFYDRNLVNITNDIIKRYGAKVGPINFGDEAIPVADDPLAQVPFKNGYKDYPNPGFDITDKMADAARQGFTLFQQPTNARGMATFYEGNRTVITLFESANLSTLLHESSHVWLEELRRNASAKDAPQDVKEDWAKIKAWFAAQGHPIGRTGFIPTEAHELFARGGERYFMEGKAPSAELQGAFTQFRAWLLRIYQVVQNLRTPITPEVREVFDRLLATQEAIDTQRELQSANALPDEALDKLGMTEAEKRAYRETAADARDEAYNALLFKTMEAIRRREQAKMKEQRSNVRAEVAAAINSKPEFIALHLLRTGRWLGDPDREPLNVKLNTGWLIDNYGEDVLDRLPRGLPIHRGDGVDGDQVAEMVAMRSGDELVQTLIAMREVSEELKAAGEKRSARDKLIDDEVDRIMAERHGDAMSDGSIEEEAIAALNTATQGEVLAGELRQLGKRKSVLGDATPYQLAREWARRKINAGRVLEVASRAALQRYTRATAKSARLAEQAILAGEMDEAFRQKQAQLLNHALLAESKAAADQVDTIVARMNRLAKRAAMKSVDQDYMDRIHMLLERYDFRPRSQKSIDEYDGFATWVQQQRAKGFEVHVPPRLEARGEHYSRVTVEELIGLNDLVQSLLHLGKTKQKMLDAQGERDYNEWRDDAMARIGNLPQRRLPKNPVGEEARPIAGAAAELLKIETFAEELDGGVQGPMNDLLVVGATDAANKREELRDKVLRPIAELYHKLGRKYRRRLQEKVTIPELTWNTLREGDPRQGQPVTITRQQLLGIFLNMGNLSNLEKMTKGERWPVATLKRVMERELIKEDYDFAQALWTQINQLWPDIVRVERAMSGVVPEQVVPTPIDTPFGTYEGGYWPVVYDSSRDRRAEANEEQRADDMFGMRSGLATQKGHTITRTEATGPMNYVLEDVLFRHLEQVVTRLSYAEYARVVVKAMSDKRLTGLIDTRIGPEYRKQVERWLGRQLREGAVNPDAAQWWNKLLRQARVNVTIAAMGLRFSTGIAQTLGLTASAQRIGARWVGVGMKEFAKHNLQAGEFIYARSPEMQRRSSAVNREMAEVAKKLRGQHTALDKAQFWAFWHIGQMDKLVSFSTWLGAHARGLKEGMTDKEASDFADKSVRLSQGSGVEKDLSRIQSLTNGEAMKFFTMFYTPFNVMFNAQWQGVRGLKKGDPRTAIGVTFWWLIASTLGDALLSGDWPDDDDESWVGWFGRNVFFGMFAGVPFARDAANYGERKLMGEYTSLTTPIARVIETVEKSVKIAGDTYEGEEVNKPVKAGGDIAAVLFGIPTSQIGTTVQFAWDHSQGEVDPQTISDYYFGYTRGKAEGKNE